MLNLKFLFILFLVALSKGQKNITVDDSDNSIVYTPSDGWGTVPDPMDIGGSHKVTTNPAATATFTFTGDAIYYSSGMWSYSVNTLISLDGGSPTLVDLTDPSVQEFRAGPETVASSVVWSQTGLDGTIEHTLVISVGPGQTFAVVDSLMFTTTDHTTTSSTSTSTTATSTSSSSSAASTPTSSSDIVDTHTAKTGLSIALGLVLTIFGLLVAGAIFWFCRRRKQKPEAETMWPGETVVSGDNLDWQAPPMMGVTRDNGPMFLGGAGDGTMIETPLSRSSSRSSGRTLPPSENLAGRGARSKSIHRPYVFGTTPSSSAPPRVFPSGGTAGAVASSVTPHHSKLKSKPRSTAGHEPTPLTSIPEASFAATRPKPVSFFYSNSPQDAARSLSPASSQGALPAVAASLPSSNTSLPNPSSSTEPWTYPQPLSFTPLS